MACQEQTDRLQIELAGIKADNAVIEAAQRYANAHGVSLSDLVECALVTYMHNNHEPVQLAFCQRHRCVMEDSTSGTERACPVTEGSTDAFTPEDIYPGH